MKINKSLTAMAILFVGISVVHAQDLFIAQTSQGADGGTSCADAHSVDWFNTPANWAAQSGKIKAGDTVHLCGSISTSLMIRGSGSSGNPITVLFEPNAKLSAPTWTGAWAGVMGAIQASNVSYVVIDGGANGVIEATNCGTNLQQIDSMGIFWGNVSNSEIKNLSIRNLYVRTSTAGEDGGGTGIYIAGGTNVSVHDNQIAETQTAIILVYPQNGLASNVKIYRNKVFHTNWGIIVGESNIDARADNIQIFSNDIGDQNIWDDPLDNFHHDGIYVFAEAPGDVVTNVKVYSNYIHGDMGLHVTAMIFTSGNVLSPLYFNNVLVNTGPNGISNGFIAGGGISPRIYNNTFVDHNTSMAMDVAPGGDIRNNLIYNNNAAVCIHQPIDANTTSDVNLTYNSTVLQFVAFAPGGNGLFYSLADWQRTYGLDKNSLTANPFLVNPAIPNGDYHLQSNSPAVGSGVNLTSLGIPELTVDADGVSRPASGPWAIGAYEYCSGNCPKTGPITTPTDSPSEIQMKPFKNVFNPAQGEILRVNFENPSWSSVDVSIYDRNGREVRKLDSTLLSAVWDGKNKSGSIVASGTYLFVLKQGGTILKRKVVVIK